MLKAVKKIIITIRRKNTARSG